MTRSPSIRLVSMAKNQKKIRRSTKPTQDEVPALAKLRLATTADSHRQRIRYLLERRLGRSVELLASETLGRALPVHVVHPATDAASTFHPSRHDNAYCQLVYATAKGREQCANCYRTHLAQAKSQTEPLIYKCHAGLTNVLVPVHLNDEVIGGLLLGRVLTKKPSAADARKIAKSVDNLCNNNEAAKALDKVPVSLESDLQLAALIARNLAQAEVPMLFEAHTFDPDASSNQSRVPALQTPPQSDPSYGKFLRHQRVCHKVAEILDHQYAAHHYERAGQPNG